VFAFVCPCGQFDDESYLHVHPIQVSTTIVTKDKSTGTEFDVRPIAQIPSTELSRDIASQGFNASVYAHSMVSDAEQLMNHILALKVKAILHNSERSEHNVMHLRSRFESQDANIGRVACVAFRGY
jgi:hypothetical protein